MRVSLEFLTNDQTFNGIQAGEPANYTVVVRWSHLNGLCQQHTACQFFSLLKTDNWNCETNKVDSYIFSDGYEDSPEFFGVKLGTYKYYDTNEDGEMIRDVEKIYKHPKYKNPKRYSNDISLIHVRKSSITASKPRFSFCLTMHK